MNGLIKINIIRLNCDHKITNLKLTKLNPLRIRSFQLIISTYHQHSTLINIDEYRPIDTDWHLIIQSTYNFSSDQHLLALVNINIHQHY